MTKRRNKDIHREIIERLHEPMDPEDLAELMYGDESNPWEKYSTGDRDIPFPPRDPPKEPANP